MPTLAVQLASGQEVLSDFFLDADSKIGDLADAAGCQLAVASSRCVLLSPSGDCMAHSMIASATNLSDSDVVTVLVMDLPRVYANPCGWAFAAVRHDGSVVTWGDAGRGGNSDEVRDQLTGGVRHVVGSLGAFAAVKHDGSVVTWGAAGLGGNSDDVKSELAGGVVHVVGNSGAFAAVKQDGSVVTWGDSLFGGNSDEVRDQLTGGVDHVVGTWYAFAAVKQDGSVVTWGDAFRGGNTDGVRDRLAGSVHRVVGKHASFCRLEGRWFRRHLGRCRLWWELRQG